MPSFPSPDPPIALPIGVHGSVKRVLTVALSESAILQGATRPKTVNFDERPTQMGQYPCVNIKSTGTSDIDFTTENNKTKTYNITIELFGESLADVELLGAAIERVLDKDGPETASSAAAQIASLSASDPDGVSIQDSGGERYWADRTNSPTGERTYRGELRYAVTIARSL